MRLIRFERFDEKAVPLPVQAQAWQLLWLAVNRHPAGNKEQTEIGYRTFLALRDVSITKGDIRSLNPDGADVYFEDAEFRLLGQAVEGFRSNITISGAEALMWIDKQLEKAPEIAKDAFKKGQRLGD